MIVDIRYSAGFMIYMYVGRAIVLLIPTLLYRGLINVRI